MQLQSSISLEGKRINRVFCLAAIPLSDGDLVLNVDTLGSFRRVGIATRDMRVYFRLVQEFKRKGAPFRSILPEDEIPSDVKVVITTPEERPLVSSRNIITVGRGFPYRLAVDRALNGPDERESFQEVVVGIDPGKKIGVASIGDGKIIHTALLHGTLKLRRELNYVFWAFPSTRRLIRIGSSGSKPLLDEITSTLTGLRWEAPVELVDEHRTSQQATGLALDLPRDILSAIQIASRLGRRIGVS